MAYISMKEEKAKPCILCQLKRPIGTFSRSMADSHGYYCEWFEVRIAADEVGDSDSPVRQMCLKHGDMFTWSTPGVTAHEYVSILRERREWRERSLSVRVAVLGAVIALLAILPAIYVQSH